MKKNAEKWYRALSFPKEYDSEFYATLERTKDIVVPNDSAKKYLNDKKDYGLNLVYFLSLCDEVKVNFEARGIEEK